MPSEDRDCVQCGRRFRGMHRHCDRCRRSGRKRCAECGCPAQSRFRDTCDACYTVARNKKCDFCGDAFIAALPQYRFCSAGCRKGFYANAVRSSSRELGRPPSPPRAPRPADELRDGVVFRWCRGHGDFVAIERIGATHNTCRDCLLAQARTRYRQHRTDSAWMEERRERSRERRHGLRLPAVLALVDAQGGCGVCGTRNPGPKGWHVDHDHACCPSQRSCPNCRRGILCHRCNSALGCFKDDASALAKAADLVAAFRPGGTRQARPSRRLDHRILYVQGFSHSYNLAYNYRLTLTDVLDIFDRQNRVCAFCSTEDPGSMGWNVDHDRACCSGNRSCGACVRAILCHLCNKGLGLLNQEVSVLRGAASYLQGVSDALIAPTSARER